MFRLADGTETIAGNLHLFVDFQIIVGAGGEYVPGALSGRFEERVERWE